MRRFAFPAIIFGIIVALGAVGFFVSPGDWGPPDRDNDVRTVQVTNPDGTTSQVQAYVVDDDNDHDRRFFFPFGLLFFPLMILLVIGLVRAVFGGPGGPGGWGGPGRYGYGPDPGWLEDWHWRQHRGTEDTGTGNSGTSGTSAA